VDTLAVRSGPLTNPRSLELSIVGVCIITWLLTAFAIVVLLVTGNQPQSRDFVCYWAAGHAFSQHQDPYSQEDIMRLERSVGFPLGSREIIMRNPPWSLPLVLPLSAVGFKTGSLIWSFVLIACLAISIHLLWILHGKQKL